MICNLHRIITIIIIIIIIININIIIRSLNFTSFVLFF